MQQHQHRRSPTPISCFPRRRPSATANPYLTTCLYNTDVGLFALSWSRTLFGRSLHLRHTHHQHRQASTFHLHMMIKPFPYNKRQGSTRLNLINIHKPATIFWDLSGAKYGSGPEPLSGFYVAIVIGSEIILLVGDSLKEAHYLIRSTGAANRFPSPMILRREHVRGTKLYSTKVNIGGHERNISIECRLVENPRLCFSIDNQRVLQIKHLKWKFRGNESIEIDGTCVQVSWDVYKWLFDDQDNGYALFMFTIFHQRSAEFGVQDQRSAEFGVQDNQDIQYNRNNNSKATSSLWPQFQHSLGFEFGLGDEKKLIKRNKGGAGLLRRSRRSSSFSSLSSANSSGSWTSSVMEWADSTEEDQLMCFPYSGFSLLIYAWKT